MKHLLCDWILSCVLSTQPVTPLPDLYYGTMLYDYYQQDYQQALLDALIVEQRGQVGDQVARFQLAKGSFAFADGMYALAEQTFASVGEGELTPLDRMRLSFHLAREHLRRQDWDGVARNLAAIDLGKNWLGHERIHPEVEFMRAELATHNGDFAAARAAIEKIDPKQSMRAYALFNLGVALREKGKLDEAANAFSTLGSSDVYSKDALDLKQRALVALSIVNRQRQRPATAESVLGAMPAAGRYRDLALTSYGGLAMDTGDYKLAARIWLTLKKQGYWTESSATAQLAFPMSLEHMASRAQALTNYYAAETNFEQRLTNLNGIAKQAEDPVWIGHLLSVFAKPDDSDTANKAVMDEWQRTLGHTDWLEWLAGEDVHELLLEWRELNKMQDWLNALPDELATFDELAATQRQRAATARELMSSQHLHQRRNQLAGALTELDRRITVLQRGTPERNAAWMLTIADDEQRQLLDNLAEKRAFLLAKMPDGADRGALLARIDHLEGIVFWNLVDEQPGRLRDAQKEAKQLTALRDQIDAKLDRVSRAEGVIASGVQTDFLAFQTRADAISAEVHRAIAERQTRLAEQIRAGIRGEIAQVERQLLITRIAIARATDQLAIDKGAGDVH